MKKIQNSILVILVLTMSSCFQNNYNTEGLVGNLNEAKLDERTCFEIPINPIINEDRSIDAIRDSVKIWVQSYDFFEMQTNKGDGYYYQRIDISGFTNEKVTYLAVIEFKDCYNSYEEPDIIPANNKTPATIKLYYPKSSLKSILNMLENKPSVLLHYHCWENAGKWAALSYFNEK